jgi:hypothetical protein
MRAGILRELLKVVPMAAALLASPGAPRPPLSTIAACKSGRKTGRLWEADAYLSTPRRPSRVVGFLRFFLSLSRKIALRPEESLVVASSSQLPSLPNKATKRACCMKRGPGQRRHCRHCHGD